jgi:beta-N-acetylhexosaminidase
VSPTAKRGRALLLPLALLSLAASAAAAPKGDFWSAPAIKASDSGSSAAYAKQAAAVVARMSDEEVLGQILMLCYPGDVPNALVFDWIGRRALGGVKIFGWNAEDSTQVARSISSMQGAALASRLGIPLLVATDQEGGWIRHIKGATTVTPGNMAIGASGRPYDAYRSANLIGRELSALGVNMNFAPSVDLATKPKSYIIGTRAFSDDPQAVAILGAAFVRGLSDAGVIATAKHFPGHGDTEDDSHGVLPVIDIDEDTLWERELLPYRVLAAEDVPAIMSGHLSFPLVSGDKLPASLSPYFMKTVLREKLGFKGLAVTDDLVMNGAGESAGSISEACVKAVEAGNDLLLISKLLTLDDPVWTRLVAACKERPSFRARAREAAANVIAVKLKYLKPKGKAAMLPDLARLASRVPDPEAADFFSSQAYRSVTAVKGSGLPFAPKGRLLVAGPFDEFLDAAAAAYPGCGSFRFSYEPSSTAVPAELASFDKALSSADSVLVCAANEAGMDFAVRAHEAGKEVALLSAQSPAPLSRSPWAEAEVAVYSYSRESLRAGVDVLSGKAQAQGKLPLKALK